jgi:MarR family transcriptional regulator, organic hydroperoxide resistance regulator
MSKKKELPAESQVYELMNAVRIFTRTSLLFQSAIAEKMNLNVTDAECLDFLMEMGPSTAGELAKTVRLTTGAVTNVIDRLEKAGFVQRGKDPSDRRKVIVMLNPSRHKEMEKFYKGMAKDVFNLFSEYSKKDLKLLIRHTSDLNDSYQKHIREVREVEQKEIH